MAGLTLPEVVRLQLWIRLLELGFARDLIEGRLGPMPAKVRQA